MPQEIREPKSFADLLLTSSWPSWAKPEPADNPTRHHKTYTFLRSVQAMKDDAIDAAKSAAWCGEAFSSPVDALESVGIAQGNLARALIDTDASFRSYLDKPFALWGRRGTVDGLKRELAHLGYTTSYVVSWRDLVDAGAGPAGTVFGGNSSFFYVGIGVPHRLVDASSIWDGGEDWDGGGIWGGGVGFDKAITEIKALIRASKPAHTSCRFIAIFWDSSSGPDAQKLPSGSYTTIPLNEPWELARPSYSVVPFYGFDPLVA